MSSKAKRAKREAERQGVVRVRAPLVRVVRRYSGDAAYDTANDTAMDREAAEMRHDRTENPQEIDMLAISHFEEAELTMTTNRGIFELLHPEARTKGVIMSHLDDQMTDWLMGLRRLREFDHIVIRRALHRLKNEDRKSRYYTYLNLTREHGDVPALIAGFMGVSRATAYNYRRDAPTRFVTICRQERRKLREAEDC